MTTSPKIQPKILIVEDSDDDAELLLRELRRSGIDPTFERFISAEGVKDALTRGPWDIVLSDHGLPRNDFPDILRLVKEHDPELPFIVVSGSIGEENAVSLMRSGVSDFIYKGNLSRLIPAIHRELAAAAQQHARREADQRFRDIVEVSGDWIWETDAEHRYTFLSNRFEDAEWADRNRAIGRTPWELIGADPDEDEHWQAHISDRNAHRKFRNFLFSVTAPRGSRHHVSMSGMPVFDRAGAFRGYRGTATDETRVVEAFWRAEEAETLLRDAVESISEGFLILDREDRIVMANEALRRLYPDIADLFAPGIAYEDLLRTAVERNVYPDAKGREAEWMTTRLEDHRDLSGGIIEKLGNGRWVMCTERRMSSGGIAGLRMDITALKKAEAQRDHLAYHDLITGLPNQAVFTDRLAQAISRLQNTGGTLAVVCLELASLNDIRDSLGFEAGDAAIREIGQRLKNTIALGETVAHIGGGQFLVLRIGIENGSAALTSIERLISPLSERLHVHGVEVPLRIAVGASVAPNDTLEPDGLIRNATTAMHQAKIRPAQPYQLYSSEMTNAAVFRSSLESDLRHAIENDELFLVYQPQVNTHTYKLAGAEALVRWRHPERGVIPPSQFIPIAEESGLIVPIGEHVLRLACKQQAEWRKTATPIPISVNLSAVQLQDPNLERMILFCMEASGLTPDAIRLELTESAILHDVQAATETMQQLAASGIRFALDDFGMEHSALSHLSDLPFDTLKIDRAFVSRMTEDRGHAALFQAIISMIHSLGMVAVAEGVEAPSQLIYLQAYGCDILQGYLFSKPLPAEEFSPLLTAGMVVPQIDGVPKSVAPTQLRAADAA